MGLNNNVKHRRDRDDASFLTLTVFPRRPPQKGFVILDIDSAALRAAILIFELSVVATRLLPAWTTRQMSLA